MRPSQLRKHGSSKRGFTLVELMVTVGIFVFMTALILARYNSYNSGTLLTNLAYDVALSIRQAQTYGLSVLKNESSGYNSAYGVHFDIYDPTKFIIFSDGDQINAPNGRYDGAGDVVVVIYNLKRGAMITNVCIGSSNDCVGGSMDILDISFKRPNPDSIIIGGYYNAGNPEYFPPFRYAEITVSDSSNSSSRVIRVNDIGQISVLD